MRSTCGFCVPDQTVKPSSRQSASAHEGPMGRASGRARRSAAPAWRRPRRHRRALVQQRAARGGIGAQRGLESSSAGSGGTGFQRTRRRRAASTACSSRSATTPTKSPCTTTATGPTPATEAVDLQRAGADEAATVAAGIRQAHHPSMQHAGHTHVVHEGQLAICLAGCRRAPPRADDAVGLDRRWASSGQRQLDMLSATSAP